MIMNESDKVKFTRYQGKFELSRKVCGCGSEFEDVILERSDKDSLHVRCANERCPQHTMAFKKGGLL